MHDKFPSRPIRHLTPEDSIWLRDLVRQAAKRRPGRESGVMVALTARLLKPSEMFKVIRALSMTHDDTMISATDLGAVGDQVIGDLDDTVRDIQNALNRGAEDGEILRLAKVYADEFSSITKEFNIRKEGRWGEQLLQTRRNVSQVLGKTMFGKRPEKIIDALPQSSSRDRHAPGARSPFAQVPNEEALLNAERSAQAIADCARISHVLGTQSSASQALNDLRKNLGNLGRNAIEGLKNLKPEDGENAMVNLMSAVRLLEIVAGPEEADLLRRRGLSALKVAGVI